MIRSVLRIVLVFAVTSGAGACAPAPSDSAPADRTPRTIQPGAPGEAAEVMRGEEAVRASRTAAEADVDFMQSMIHHHAQALEMIALVPERTRRPDLRLLARRIGAGQTGEIDFMRRWLRERGEHVPDPEAPTHAHGHHMSMPGMLSREQIDRLEAVRGPEFDQLFLELMIVHHQGAIEMVDDLFASPHGGQETDVFEFANHVHTDQTVEIERMRGMLAGPR